MEDRPGDEIIDIDDHYAEMFQAWLNSLSPTVRDELVANNSKWPLNPL